MSKATINPYISKITVMKCKIRTRLLKLQSPVNENRHIVTFNPYSTQK